ncbi:MAG TPA: metalloregulator ArsR/SmtB family transcription factor [Burkholderiaceae bacterium]|nr:metalloregulator ArsR/SmtB family transcription factor [Burkholderiaceae bacterium]HMX12305.1 metalloregulator ArsR/SmtB family transcription factor [Burkholderiaceae bacterium]HNG81603.1 metalloregulator ArsR/SmtB family transcription factor [Burkholderiaceae bacterium]
MATRSTARSDDDAVFTASAELFALLATPVRLKVIRALDGVEKNVSQLQAEVGTTQPNLSQHLSTLYRAGVLTKRREGTQIHYRLASERVGMLCRAVCQQVALELEGRVALPAEQRLLPLGGR